MDVPYAMTGCSDAGASDPPAPSASIAERDPIDRPQDVPSFVNTPQAFVQSQHMYGMFDYVVPLPEVPDPVGPIKYDAPYGASGVGAHGPLFEFLTPNQPGTSDPPKAPPGMQLQELALPPPCPLVGTPIATPINTPGTRQPMIPEYFTNEMIDNFTPLPAAVHKGEDLPVQRRVDPPAIRCEAPVREPARKQRRRGPARAVVFDVPDAHADAPASPKSLVGAAGDVPTRLEEFVVSPGLERDLAFFRSKRPPSARETERLLVRIYGEAEAHADKRKLEVRDHMKQELEASPVTLTSRKRSLMRSRREAKVSRVAKDVKHNCLRSVIRHLIASSPLQTCTCVKACGKRKARPDC